MMSPPTKTLKDLDNLGKNGCCVAFFVMIGIGATLAVGTTLLLCL